jgi:hypothetical protein
MWKIFSVPCGSALYKFHRISIHIMTLGFTQNLTELSIRNLPGGKWLPTPNADNLTAICDPILYTVWDSRCLSAL